MLELEKIVLNAVQPWSHAQRFCVAFSGGMDSTVLLYTLTQLAQQHALPALRAIYIHHGLQEAAQSWPEHCQQVCDALQVPLSIVRVSVAPVASVEQAAREARYAAFAQHLQADEVLMMAQHQDDQAETLLFRLMRGTGVAGLRGIPVARPLAQGHVLRPLLTISQQQLLQYAKQHQLVWIEDPTNVTDSFDRNYLRRQVIPALKSRWPTMQHSLQRTAEHMHEAQQLLDDLAYEDLQRVQGDSGLDWLILPCLNLEKLRELTLVRQKNLLRYWLAPFTLLPDAAHWAGWESLRDAQTDAQPLWRLHSGALVRSQNQIYWLAEFWLQPPPDLNLTVNCAGCYPLPDNGVLLISGDVSVPLQVRYRQGGERFFIVDRGHRDLKRLLQEQAIPQFIRARLPLLFVAEQPVALANVPALNHPDIKHLRVTWQVPAAVEHQLAHEI
ncbi:tRNA lysidine(34) synthetase TilS [Pseudomonas sp. C27(2019)]|uniref:tRNA lysidine(34) synthetase TilS n=1 Tax=Pseudomonas sp. C27(2019) TaxID=2604941 RepID=UPI0012453ADF|nr:tRNA lysidine(34) synthetase TilS [Pseudomonas sp. C27(2019)]QEY58473.1 tRNA lysidine(34) synthetase TilS [Pseudomonas sp. C27(2019)]